MNRLKHKSLLLTSSVYLSLLFLIVIAVMTTYLYMAQRNAAFDEYLRIGDTLRAQSEAHVDLIEPLAGGLLAGREAPTDEAAALRRLLNAMTRDDMIENAYLLVVNAEPLVGSDKLMFMELSETFGIPEELIGQPYDGGRVLLEGYREALSHGAHLTPSFVDDYGHWLSYLTPILSAKGEPVAVLGIDYHFGKVEERMRELLLQSVLLGALAAGLAIGTLLPLLRAVIRPLRMLRDNAKLAADGDLTVSIPATSGNEIGQAAHSFNEIIGRLREVAISISRSVRGVEQISAKLDETAGQTALKTQDMTKSIQSAVFGIESHLDNLRNCQNTIANSSSCTQRIDAATGILSDLAVDTAQWAMEGGIVIDHMMGRIEQLEQHVAVAVNSIRELNEYGCQIERSMESSEEISAVLQTFFSHTSSLIQTLENTAEKARENSGLVSSSNQSFRSILATVEQVGAQVHEISAASVQMSAGNARIAAALLELSHSAYTSAGSAQQAAAASKVQLASAREAAGAAKQLRPLAADLDVAVGRFRL